MDFTNYYNNLNYAQKKAVDTIEGPVLTIAGPGTGKTQILAVRVANILRTQTVNPENILCITFTDSGVVAIKKRLRFIIGTKAANKVNVYTFHGLCNKIISDSPEEFSDFKTLVKIDDYNSIKAVQSILDTNKYKNLISPSNKYYHLKNIRGLISECKKESISSSSIREYYTDQREHYLDVIENKGKSTKVLKDAISKCDAMIEFSDLLDEYNSFMTRAGFYDYDDMISFVNKKFLSSEEFLLDYQERFQYFLVDEFQDTNNSQYKLVELLAGYFESPNLFVVGDDDQSIYRFQGASTENILNLRDKFPDIEQILLILID